MYRYVMVIEMVKGICENCGRETNIKPIKKGIWDYGVRTVKTLYLCKKCEGM